MRDVLRVLSILVVVGVMSAQDASISGNQYLMQGKFSEAIPELEKAASTAPGSVEIRISLGEAYIGVGQTQKGLAILDKAANERPLPWIQCGIALWLAAHQQLDAARKYAQAAVRSAEGDLQKLELNKVDQNAFRLEVTLARSWDVLGFVYTRRGDLDDAERFLNAAWVLAQEPSSGEHLAQLYETRGQTQEAMRTYAQAIAVGAEPFTRKMRNRLTLLAGGEDKIEPLLQGAGSEMVSKRTVRVGKLHVGKSSAEFYVQIVPAPGMPKARFVDGDAALSTAEHVLQSTPLPFAFPDATLTKLFRRGMLRCTESGDCAIDLLNANWYTPSASSNGNGSPLGPRITAPVPLRRVEPQYTEVARRAKLQGTVVLYVEVDRKGHARNIKVIRSLGSGLDEEAIKAVERWEFKPGERDGEPVTVAATIEVNFVLQ